jgi:hypothetical protein
MPPSGTGPSMTKMGRYGYFFWLSSALQYFFLAVQDAHSPSLGRMMICPSPGKLRVPCQTSYHNHRVYLTLPRGHRIWASRPLAYSSPP